MKKNWLRTDINLLAFVGICILNWIDLHYFWSFPSLNFNKIIRKKSLIVSIFWVMLMKPSFPFFSWESCGSWANSELEWARPWNFYQSFLSPLKAESLFRFGESSKRSIWEHENYLRAWELVYRCRRLQNDTCQNDGNVSSIDKERKGRLVWYQWE